MILYGILLLELASGPNLNDQPPTVSNKPKVSDFISSLVDFSNDRKKHQLLLSVDVNNQKDRNRLCALFQSQVNLTCNPSKVTVAEVSTKDKIDSHRLNDFLDQIMLEFSHQKKWEIDVKTSIEKQTSSVEIAYKFQEQ